MDKEILERLKDYPNVYIQEIFGTGIFLGLDNDVLYMLLDGLKVKKTILEPHELKYVSKILHLELGQYITFEHKGWFDIPNKNIKEIKFTRHINYRIITKAEILNTLFKPSPLRLLNSSTSKS